MHSKFKFKTQLAFNRKLWKTVLSWGGNNSVHLQLEWNQCSGTSASARAQTNTDVAGLARQPRGSVGSRDRGQQSIRNRGADTTLWNRIAEAFRGFRQDCGLSLMPTREALHVARKQTVYRQKPVKLSTMQAQEILHRDEGWCPYKLEFTHLSVVPDTRFSKCWFTPQIFLWTKKKNYSDTINYTKIMSLADSRQGNNLFL